MTSTPTPPVADPGPPPAAAPSAPPSAASIEPRGSDRFFAWIAGLGIARADGWLGGVCAGVAARLRIDPLIVRGIVVVIALFGFPVLFVYAVAWSLLPDIDGRIHVRELLRGRFDPAIVGIGILVLLSFFPVVPWTFQLMLPSFMVFPGYVDWSPFGVLSTLVGLALVGGLVFLIVRAARRTPPGVSTQDPRTASADPADPGAPAAADTGIAASAGGLGVDAEGHALASAAASAPAPEPVLAESATDEEVAVWRRHHAAWKTQDHEWRRQQQDAERVAREQARRERQAAGAALAAAADERRRARRLSKPRTSLAYVATVAGLALVAGSAAGMIAVATDPASAAFAPAVGLLVAAIVVALSMVVAGIARRRSGFLAFVTVALLVAGTIATAVPATRGIALGNAYLNNIEGPFQLTQPFGSLSIDLASQTGSRIIRVDKASGDTHITLADDLELALNATLGSGIVQWTRIDESTGEMTSGTLTGTLRPDGSRRIVETVGAESGSSGYQQVVLDQTTGDVFVTIYAR